MPEALRPSPSRSAVGRLSRSSVGRLTGRLTRRLASTTSVKAAGKFLRRQLWAWPLIAASGLAATGYLVDRAVERAMSRQREAELTTILNADVEALRVWMVEQGRNAALLAEDERLARPLAELLAASAGGAEAGRALLQSPAQAEIRARLRPRLKALDYGGFFLVSPAGLVVAAEQDPPVGKALVGYRRQFFDRVLAAGPSVSKPYRSPLLLQDEAGEYRANLPSMFAAAPLKDAAGKPIAALGVRIRPDREFTHILRVAQAGATGETYAFDRDGLFLSNSRFDDGLKRIGLLADLPDSQSVLTLAAARPRRGHDGRPPPGREPAATAADAQRRRGRRRPQRLRAGRLPRLPRRAHRGGVDVAARVRLRRRHRDGPGRGLRPRVRPAAGVRLAHGPARRRGRRHLRRHGRHGPAAPAAPGGGPASQAPRPVHARGEARRRRHGDRLPGAARHAAAGDRRQAPQPRPGLRHGPRPVRAGGAGDQRR